jgi:DNA-binding transcriptional regulator/RsmH inhibitor MraZ
VLTAQGNKLELWDQDTYYKYLEQNSVNYSQLAQSVSVDFGNIFEN